MNTEVDNLLWEDSKKLFFFNGQLLGYTKIFYNFLEVFRNPLREGFHMSYFSMFLKNCTCVKNSFKSATTTTAARVFKTISPEAGPMFLHDLTCSRLRRYCWPPVEILSWLEKTYKRKCFLAETSVSLRLARELEPPWECKFSPGQYAPKPGELHQGPGLCLGRWMTRRGTRRMRLVPTFGGGGSGTTTLTWRYSLFRGRLLDDTKWEREEESRSDMFLKLLVKEQVYNQGGATLWGLWNPTSFPWIKIKCIRYKKVRLWQPANFERKATFVM